MTDLEMTKLCAEAVSLTLRPRIGARNVTCGDQDLLETRWGEQYDPLASDMQAMALVKTLKLNVCSPCAVDLHPGWEVYGDGIHDPVVINADLNRAIVECAAKMQRGTPNATTSVP